jgi:very-short-patch-repair endonuclease
MVSKKNLTIGQLAHQLARELRKKPTKSEMILWNFLKNKKFLNLRFLRQHPVFYRYNDLKIFFVDFYCHELRWVIELDDQIHAQQYEYDQVRTDFFRF